LKKINQILIFISIMFIFTGCIQESFENRYKKEYESLHNILNTYAYVNELDYPSVINKGRMALVMYNTHNEAFENLYKQTVFLLEEARKKDKALLENFIELHNKDFVYFSTLGLTDRVLYQGAVFDNKIFKYYENGNIKTFDLNKFRVIEVDVSDTIMVQNGKLISFVLSDFKAGESNNAIIHFPVKNTESLSEDKLKLFFGLKKK